ncbi:MAG: MaoC family dehydratase [Anaerolineae bacterium]|nr:MaoC family dehydratase [Anaerolineae bacterium]
MPDNTVVTTVDELRKWVGKETGVSDWLLITQDRVNAFADATDDHQFIHVDPAAAALTPFGGTIAHGFLTLALIVPLRQRQTGLRLGLPLQFAVNYGVNRVRFPAPIHVGARIRLRSTLLALDDIAPSTVQLTFADTVEIEGEAKPGCYAESILRLYVRDNQ